MPKYDPKLLKAVNGTALVAMSKEIGVKNAEKVSKEQLIGAFLDTVESLSATDPSKLTAPVVDFYNNTVTTLKLDQPQPDETPAPAADEEAPATAVAAAPAPVPVTPAPAPVTAPVAAPAPRLATRVAQPAAPAAAPGAPAAEKAKRQPPPRGDVYTRWMGLGEALGKLKAGKISELITLADKIYQEHGGKENERESTGITKATLVMLKSWGKVDFDKENFTLK